MTTLNITSASFDNLYAQLTVTGTSENISGTLTLHIVDKNGAEQQVRTRVNADGTFSFNQVDIDNEALSLGNLSLTVTGNESRGSGTVSATYAGEVVYSIFEPSITSTVHLDTDTGLMSITGVSHDMAPGTPVSFTVNDTAGNTLTVHTVLDENGNYTYNNLDVTSLLTGDLTVTTNALDRTNNPVQDIDMLYFSVTGTITTETTLNNETGLLTITGHTTFFNNNGVLEIIITDIAGNTLNFTTKVQANATHTSGTYTLSDIDVSSLVDGDLTVSVRGTDIQLHLITNNTAIELDFMPGSIDTIVEVDNDNALLNLTGTSKEIPEGNQVTITITDSEGHQVTTQATVDKDGQYAVPNVDVSSLVDGELTVDSSALDKQGRTATDKDLTALDTMPGSIDTIVEVDNDNLVLHLTGTSKSIPEGNQVTITITDSEGHQLTTQATVDKDGHYAAPNVDASGFVDGELTVDSSTLDKQGRTATDKDVAELDIAYGSIDTHINVNAKCDVMYITGTSTDVKAGSKVYIKITDKNGHYINTSAIVDQQGNYKVGYVNISRLAVGELTVDSVAVDRSGHTVTDKDLADNVFDRYINAQRLSEVTINDSISASYPSLREWKTYKHNSVFDPTLGPMTDDNNDHINVQYYITNRTHISTYGGDDVVKIGTNIDNSTVNLGEGNNTLIVGAANWVDGYITNKAKVIAGSGNDYLSVRTNIDTSTVDLGDGDNTIHVGGYITGAYTDVITGAGNDILTVGTNIQSADINLGAGDNEIRVGGYIAGAQASITTYEGNDYLSVGSNVASASINLGDGDNTINIGGYVTAKASITTGAGDDLVTINSNVDGSTLDLGNGANNLHIGGYVTNSVINTGAEQDIITINGQVFGNSVINTGAGNDDISVGSLGNAKINGGEGHDTLHITSMDKDISFSNVLNVEHIDLGEGTQWLKDVNYKNMVKAGVTSLHIEGDSSDWVALGTINATNNTKDNSGADKSAAWNYTGTETENGVTYNVYTYSADNNYQVYVDQDVNVY